MGNGDAALELMHGGAIEIGDNPGAACANRDVSKKDRSWCYVSASGMEWFDPRARCNRAHMTRSRRQFHDGPARLAGVRASPWDGAISGAHD